MPPSIVASQGEQKESGAVGGLEKETLQLAMQKLMEYRNTLQGLVTVMRSVDPESVALIGPAVEVGKALESRLEQVVQRAGSKQPSMAGMQGGQGAQPQMQGGSANGI